MAKKKSVPPPPVLTWEESHPWRWYAIACGSAAEARVALHLRKYCEMLELSHLFDTYLIPTEQVIQVNAGGEKIIKRERLFAGYLLVRLRMTGELNDLILSTPGVQQIISDRTGVKPLWILDNQISKVVAMMIEAETNESRIRRRPKMTKGMKVMISNGTFQNFTGEVLEHVGTKVRVQVNIFGRITKALFEEDIVVPESGILSSATYLGG
jgi:transcriptional antiterminator NusG